MQRWRFQAAAAAFDGWRQYLELRAAKRDQLRLAIARWRAAQLASLFALWRDRAAATLTQMQELAQVTTLCIVMATVGLLLSHWSPVADELCGCAFWCNLNCSENRKKGRALRRRAPTSVS